MGNNCLNCGESMPPLQSVNITVGTINRHDGTLYCYQCEQLGFLNESEEEQNELPFDNSDIQINNQIK